MTATLAQAPVETRTREQWEQSVTAAETALRTRWPDGVPW